MITVKRIEIVVAAPHSRRVTRLLDRHHLEGWSLVRSVQGSGHRGAQQSDEITGASSNHLIITTCTEAQLLALTKDLRAVLEECGGICLVSDAMWLRH